jgi:hypothetical protein
MAFAARQRRDHPRKRHDHGRWGTPGLITAGN